jgi:hypothetical protein
VLDIDEFDYLTLSDESGFTRNDIRLPFQWSEQELRYMLPTETEKAISLKKAWNEILT